MEKFYFSEDMLSDVHTEDVSDLHRTKPWCPLLLLATRQQDHHRPSRLFQFPQKIMFVHKMSQTDQKGAVQTDNIFIMTNQTRMMFGRIFLTFLWVPA